VLLREFSKMEVKWEAAYLKRKGVSSAEADTYALARAARALGLKVSWNRPLLFKSVTTFCPFEKHYKAVCGHSCHGKLIRLDSPRLPFPLLLSEKAYFSESRESRVPRAAWREVMNPSLSGPLPAATKK
jgi:hypothetical protein